MRVLTHGSCPVAVASPATSSLVKPNPHPNPCLSHVWDSTSLSVQHTPVGSTQLEYLRLSATAQLAMTSSMMGMNMQQRWHPRLGDQLLRQMQSLWARMSRERRHRERLALIVDGRRQCAVHLAPYTLLLLHVQDHHLRRDLTQVAAWS